MTETSLIAATLGLAHPWKITSVTFYDEETRIEITVDFSLGGSFTCPRCGATARVCETATEVWHHSNFFHYSAYLTVRVPHLECTNGCGCDKIELPWTRRNPRFTLIPQS